MQPSKIVKALALALPLLTLAACGTTPEDEAPVQDTNNQVEQSTDSGADVTVSSIEKEREFEMMQKKQAQEALRQNTLVRFEFDKSRIAAEYFEVLDAHAAFLRDNADAKVVVEGHCDERGTPEYNIALGERRAKAVTRYLKNLGVSSSQISTVSYGEEKPADTSRSEAAFAANRRAVLVY